LQFRSLTDWMSSKKRRKDNIVRGIGKRKILRSNADSEFKALCRFCHVI